MIKHRTKVKWTEVKSLNQIPEQYWGEDLSMLDKHHSGVVIGTNVGFWGDVYLIVLCQDGKIRKVNAELVKVVGEDKP